MSVVDIERKSYAEFVRLRHGAPLPRIVIATSGRAEAICQKTLRVLKKHKFPMNRVHLFVPPTKCRTKPDSWQKTEYRIMLRKYKFRGVRMHTGGINMLQQCQRITKHFKEGTYLMMMSDNIDDIVVRRSNVKVAAESLPEKHLLGITAHAWHLMKHTNTKTWSLACCKNTMNMCPGIISRKFGLLDGNAYGFINRHDNDLQHQHDSMTVDLEWSCRAWERDGGFFRYQGVSALKKYRSPGGFQDAYTVELRQKLTAKAVKTLADKFPRLIRYNSAKESSRTMQPYRTMPLGPPPFKYAAEIENRGRTREYMQTRPSTSTERMRRLRSR